jgi:ABC-2 type transport system ATP-binding protein
MITFRKKTPMTHILIATSLHKSFGETHAVQGVSLTVSAGEIYALVGPDGAGKTTTIRLLCGALKADGGSVTIAGYDVERQTEQARSQLGYLSQRFSLYNDLTVIENIRFFAELRGLKPKEWEARALYMLDFIGLVEFKNRRAGQLSGGMKQKLGLAIALVTEPKLLLLDEPTTGVDPGTRQDFWQLIIQLVLEKGMAVVLSTPYMDEASRCTRVGFLREGRLLAEDTPRALRQRLAGRVLELAGEPEELLMSALKAESGVENVQRFGDRLHVRTAPDGAKTVVANLSRSIPAQGGKISHLAEIAPSLEDVFIEMAEVEK